jgi:hypothetical protein
VTGARSIAAALVVAATLGANAGRSDARAPLRAAPCTAPEYHQFDFFIGEWDVYDVGANVVKARNSVARMLDGCAIREVYRRRDGYEGESFTTYDPARRAWHQSWVTNRGELLLLDGALRGNTIVLTGPDRSPRARGALIRGIWVPEHDGSVRETAERSVDGGTTWTPLFHIRFVARRLG